MAPSGKWPARISLGLSAAVLTSLFMPVNAAGEQASTADAAVSFLNPSPYGSVTNVGKKQDIDAAYHIVTRVSSLDPVAGVEVFYRSGSNPLVKIGDATRVDQTEAWEIYWPVDVPDGTYTLIARIRDTSITAEQSATVRNNPSQTDPTVVPFETVEITSPRDGASAMFLRGRLTMRGVASAGADGVTLYYTTAGPTTTPAAEAWTSCGTSILPDASAPKEFTLDCVLAGSDQPGMVTGVAALANNCLQNCADETTTHSGDAHRVFGTEGDQQPVCDVSGTNGPNVLEGSDASEKICGFGGNDTIRGGGGNDLILGGKGRDILRGNAGDDVVKGGPGLDRLFGNGGHDLLNGGAGRDSCRGGRGRDRLRKCETGTRSFAARTRRSI